MVSVYTCYCLIFAFAITYSSVLFLWYMVIFFTFTHFLGFAVLMLPPNFTFIILMYLLSIVFYTSTCTFLVICFLCPHVLQFSAFAVFVLSNVCFSYSLFCFGLLTFITYFQLKKSRSILFNVPSFLSFSSSSHMSCY